MDNLLALSWLHCFGALTIGIIAFIAYFVSRKKGRAKQVSLPIILLVLMVYYLYVGIPYIKDCVIKGTQAVKGQIVDESALTYKLSRTVYSYTLQDQNGQMIELYVDEDCLDTLKMEVGFGYEVVYFNNSKAVESVTRMVESTN